MILIKKDELTTSRRLVYFFCSDDDSADAYAPKTGLSFSTGDLKVSKAGAAEANASGTTANGQVTEIGRGWYSYRFSAGEIDTLGVLGLFTNVTDVYSEATFAQVVSFDPYDAAAIGMTNLDAQVSSRLPTASYENLTTQLDASNTIETGLGLRGLYRLMAAVLVGKLSGAGTGTEVFRNAIADSKARVTATVDTSGNRTVITTDQT